MNIPSPRAQKRARIEIIPLIDVIFFLLATFMMVSLSMIRNKGLTVNLPSAAASVPQRDEPDIVISITKDGKLFFNKEEMTGAELPARLQKLKAEYQDPRVFINGDGDSLFSSAVGVLDDLRQAGIVKVAIQTKEQK